MKAKILSLFSLLALLLISTAILADGRPTGIRISRLVSGGGTNVELDATVTGTNFYYTFAGFSSTVFMGPGISNGVGNRGVEVTPGGDLLFYGIDWGDGSVHTAMVLFGPAGGPFTGTFSHTYADPGTYQVTIGDAYGIGIINKGGIPFTGNPISASTRYVADSQIGPFTFTGTTTWTTGVYQLIGMTAQATVTTGTGIPTLNIYGLLAMSLVLVGAGVLVYRRPQRTVV